MQHYHQIYTHYYDFMLLWKELFLKPTIEQQQPKQTRRRSIKNQIVEIKKRIIILSLCCPLLLLLFVTKIAFIAKTQNITTTTAIQTNIIPTTTAKLSKSKATEFKKSIFPSLTSSSLSLVDEDQVLSLSPSASTIIVVILDQKKSNPINQRYMQQYNIVSDYYYSFIKTFSIFSCHCCNIVSTTSTTKDQNHCCNHQRQRRSNHSDQNQIRNHHHCHHHKNHHHHRWFATTLNPFSCSTYCCYSNDNNKRQTETFTTFYKNTTTTIIAAAANNFSNNNNQKFLIVITLILFILFQLFDLSLSSSFTAIKFKTETNNQIHRSKIDNTSYNAIINGEISLPCNITAPSFDDGVSLVLWYRDDIATPIYTVDARQSMSLERAQHFLHTDLFEKRATFNLSYPLSFLHIKHVKPNDGGDYRCRVDFRRARTVNRILKLTVIVPTTNVIIYDQNFKIIEKIAGPFEEDSTQSLICDSSEGNPLPVVHWWRGSNLIDTEYFIVNNTISRNVLTLTNLSRDDLQISLTCQAYNTNLTVPIVKTITLDLYLKPKEIRIITPLDNTIQQQQKHHSNISANTTSTILSATMSSPSSSTSTKNSFTAIELACQCIGSKPPAKIKWKKGPKDEWLDAFSQIISNDGLTTTSFLSFVPSIDDNGKNLYCIGYNPKISEIYSIENFWPININYAPILSLVMGSNSLSQDIVEGSNVYFECDIKANPYVHTFGWKLNGQILDLNPSSSLSSSSTFASSSRILTSTLTENRDDNNRLSHVEMRNTSLLLTNVNHEHHGHYQCFASNKLGSSQSESVFLNVKYSPRCKHSTVIPIGVALEETVSIECQVLANPINVQFEWRMENIINNKTFINNKSIPFTTQGLKSIAKYRSMTIEDYGYLYCQASNSVGRQDKPCVFQIIKAEAPSHPHNCSLVNKTAHSLTVECLPGYSGGLEQTFFLQVYSLNPNHLLKNLSNNQMPYFSIDDLPAGYIFKLVIYSSNRKGISKPIEITGSTTEPSPWKSADYGVNDSTVSAMTPLILVISLVVIILILLLSILMHIRNRIKGRMRTVVQASDNKQQLATITTMTTTAINANNNNNITPKSIMKKKQKNFENISTLGITDEIQTTMVDITDGVNHLVDHHHHNHHLIENDSDISNVINVNDMMLMANETIEINDLTTFKPDYIRNVAVCIESNNNTNSNNINNGNGSSTTTTTTTNISPLPYTTLVPSSSSTTTTEFLLNDENHNLSLQQQQQQHHNTQHLSPLSSSSFSHPHHQHHQHLPSQHQQYHHHHPHQFTISNSNNNNSITSDAKMEISSLGSSYEVYGIPDPMEIIEHHHHHHHHQQLQHNHEQNDST